MRYLKIIFISLVLLPEIIVGNSTETLFSIPFDESRFTVDEYYRSGPVAFWVAKNGNLWLESTAVDSIFSIGSNQEVDTAYGFSAQLDRFTILSGSEAYYLFENDSAVFVSNGKIRKLDYDQFSEIGQRGWVEFGSTCDDSIFIWDNNSRYLWDKFGNQDGLFKTKPSIFPFQKAVYEKISDYSLIGVCENNYFLIKYEMQQGSGLSSLEILNFDIEQKAVTQSTTIKIENSRELLFIFSHPFQLSIQQRVLYVMTYDGEDDRILIRKYDLNGLMW